MTRRRHLAILGAALVAGAFEAAHGLAWQGTIAAWPIVSMVVGMVVELEVLTLAFDRSVARRRSVTWSFVLASGVAIGLGIAGSVTGWLIERAVAIPMVGLAVVLQIGAFNGVVGLGLWAVAVLLPFAVEAGQLRTAAELARLRANLQPHFLLNTLSTVSGLVTEDPREARDLIGALGDLLRDAAEAGDELQTIDAEVAWLQRYAKILEMRHRGSLTFRWDIAEPARRVRIPRLLLQPLVENAVKHGALRRRDGGEVAVRATVDAARLICVVEDNGPGPAAGAPRDGAQGLELVRRRLALEYVGAAAFRLESDAGRTRSIVELPVTP